MSSDLALNPKGVLDFNGFNIKITFSLKFFKSYVEYDYGRKDKIM